MTNPQVVTLSLVDCLLVNSDSQVALSESVAKLDKTLADVLDADVVLVIEVPLQHYGDSTSLKLNGRHVLGWLPFALDQLVHKDRLALRPERVVFAPYLALDGKPTLQRLIDADIIDDDSCRDDESVASSKSSVSLSGMFSLVSLSPRRSPVKAQDDEPLTPERLAKLTHYGQGYDALPESKRQSTLTARALEQSWAFVRSKTPVQSNRIVHWTKSNIPIQAVTLDKKLTEDNQVLSRWQDKLKRSRDWKLDICAEDLLGDDGAASLKP